MSIIYSFCVVIGFLQDIERFKSCIEFAQYVPDDGCALGQSEGTGATARWFTLGQV